MYGELKSSISKNVIPAFLYDSCFSNNYKYQVQKTDVLYCLNMDLINLLDSNDILRILKISDTSRLKIKCPKNGNYRKCNRRSFHELLTRRLIVLKMKHQINQIWADHMDNFSKAGRATGLFKKIDTSAYFVYEGRSFKNDSLPYYQVFKFSSNGLVKMHNVFQNISRIKIDNSEFIESIYYYDVKKSLFVLEYYHMAQDADSIYKTRKYIKVGRKGFIYVNKDPRTNELIDKTPNPNWFYRKIYLK